jgi:FMN phosphatase YigB (HAD superfamily)
LPIKAITFDFWSTLYKSNSVDYSKRLVSLKEALEQRSGTTFGLEQFEVAIEVARDTWNQAWIEEYRTITADEWLAIVLNSLNSSLRLEQLSELVDDMENSIFNDLPALVPEARAVLTDLSGQYRLAIISDTGITPGRVLRQILKDDGVIDYFCHLTFSDEVGYSKPHPKAFLTTLEALGVNPQEAVHVGDLLRTDIAGAQQAGMRAVQYIGISDDTPSMFPDTSDSTVTPDAIISNHLELKALLLRWNGAEPGSLTPE